MIWAQDYFVPLDLVELIELKLPTGSLPIPFNCLDTKFSSNFIKEQKPLEIDEIYMSSCGDLKLRLREVFGDLFGGLHLISFLKI